MKKNFLTVGLLAAAWFLFQAVAPIFIGSSFVLGTADQAAFPTCNTALTGALIFGTDGGGFTYSCSGTAWRRVKDE